MEENPIPKFDPAAERKILEERLIHAREKLAKEEPKENSYYRDTYREKVQEIEFHISALDENYANKNLALEVNLAHLKESRARVSDIDSAIAHRVAIEQLWRSHDTSIMESLDRNTQALLAIAKAIESTK